MSKKLMLVGTVLVAALGLALPASAELIGYWNFDEGSGEIAIDQSGNGNDGILENGVEWTDGQSGYAVQFDGTDDCVNLGNAGNLSITDDFSFSMWVKISEYPTSWRNMLSKLVDDQHVEYNFRYKTATEGQFYYGTGSAAIVCMWNPTEDLPLNTWTHIAGVRKSMTHVKVYFNGVEKRSLNVTTQAISTSANVTIGRQSNNTFYFTGAIDEVALFSHAMEEAEVLSAMSGLGNKELASKPNPTDEAVDVPRDVELGWVAGEFAATHDVYLGTSFDAVAGASRGDPMDVLLSQGQTDTSYVSDELLEIGQTYYWRIDEVNAAPDNGIFEGEVWSFTVEPMSYPIENMTVTTNATYGDTAAPENTINGSGLDADDLHSDLSTDMFLGTPPEGEPVWLLYEFDGVYKLYDLLVWNYNAQFEAFLGFSVQNMTVEYSVDGVEWTVLGDVEVPQGSGAPGHALDATVDFAGVAARYVRLTLNANYGTREDLGLAEIRFSYIPVQARTPEPADNATDVSVETDLTWRAGRDAVSHEIYLGTDPDALTLADTVSTSRYVPDELALGTTYYWQINEVQDTEAWASDIWSFATEDYLVIDDFESYNDEDNVIYETWLDGWVNGTASIVGYFEAPFAEQTVVHGGRQSMPLQYDNSISPYYSEAEKDLGGLALDASGATALRLFVAGQAPPYVASDSTIAMSAIGTDIWGAADQFRYAYMSLSGDGAIVARVDGIYRSNEWVKGGVMIRESTEPGAPFAAVYLTGDYGVRYQARLESDVDAVSDSSVITDEQVAMRAPVWVKIERVGNDFNGYYSADGETWTTLVWSPQTIAMGSDVTIGIALTSHDAAISTGGSFSGIATTGGASGAWQMAEIGVAQPTDAGNDIEPLYVALEDSTGKVAVVTNPNPAAVANPAWQEWLIPYSELTGINLSNVSTMYIGVGDRNNPTSGGAGTVFIDDVAFGYPTDDD